MIRKLMLALLLLGTACLVPSPVGQSGKAAFAVVNCSSTCTAAAKRQCAAAGGFCGYNPDFGTCGCVYP